MSRVTVDEYLTSVYYDPKRPGSFGGAESLYRDVKEEGKLKISRKQISDWLASQDTYTLHKPARRNFKRNRVIVGGIDEEWQLDLADTQSLKRYNDGYRYLLVCIDVFSKYAWIVPIKSKTGSALVEAFKVILSAGRKPQKIMTDQGTEFFNKSFQTLLNNESIQLFNTFNETKASVVERVIRTFKTRMWRYFTAKKTLRYIDMLPELVYSYNHSQHRSIKTKPALVNAKNEDKVWHILYGSVFDNVQSAKYKFKIGDQVRISKIKRKFDKGYSLHFRKRFLL